MQQVNTCESRHDALVRAATRSTQGYAVSGVVVVICLRHCRARDLQVGEKYCNVDFIVLAALVGVTLLRIVLTYDIACQWLKNFRKHMDEFPPEM
ncbi:hypothetical protein K443DRAFT_113647 [Laccaria amethystina LaAM-08-1]|uniref:Uncharacterized protein n=1 Tax=Laccaria amethystina LaAM-08-1 TaxID=1095629 RepID=A0A0C9X437_9AGAR|nr:hypothetical protein K443DRAFT_113647 [Laccaria amethystina LaAM-08-1]